MVRCYAGLGINEDVKEMNAVSGNLNYYYYKMLSVLRSKKNFYKEKDYAGKEILTSEKLNEELADMIRTGVPFFAGRMGSSEQFCFNVFEFQKRSYQDKAVKQLQSYSGFFPASIASGEKFSDLVREVFPNVDILGVWNLPAEDYCLKKYGSKNIRLTHLPSLEPWRSENPWSRVLRGKRVLVIHPFKSSIEKQYEKRERIFANTEILPEFELIAYPAVQTIAGSIDSRFGTWFEALDFMTDEIQKIDFDIAILGCGAYGFPLASRIKDMGKQAVHLGGATQLFFGIMGQRWENDEAVRKFVNSDWIRPSREETPENKEVVEGGCYW